MARLSEYEAKWVLAQVDDYIGTAYQPMTENMRTFMRRALEGFVPGKPLDTLKLELEAELNAPQGGVLLRMMNEAALYPPLTEAQIASIKRGLADAEAGRTFSHEEVMRRFGIKR
jgi:hypothetical protein